MSSGLGVVPEPMDNSPEALSLDPTTLAQPPPTEVQASQPAKNFFARTFKRADIVLVALLVVGMAALLISTTQHKSKTPSANSVTSEYTTQQIPLAGLITTEQGASFGPSNVIINGTLKASGGLVITPSVQPNAPATGQLYYDQNTNQLAYFNGTQYISLTQQGAVVQSVGGITGAITLGGGLSVVGNQLTVSQPAAAANVSSLGGVTGAVTVGSGLKIVGSDLRNDGVLSLVPGTPNLIVANDGNGNLTISNVGGGSGTVTSGGGTVGRIAKFTGVQNVEDSLLSESGGTVTTNGNLAVTGALSLSAALTVANGGTGVTSLTANGIVIGQGAGAVTTVTSGGAGLCLMSTAGAPSFQACPSGSGVASLNSLTGAVTVANASAAGSTVTIDSATTVAKGIASFNATNFSVAAGAVNLIQDINTGATPTFAGLNTNTITPSGAFTVGALAQMFTLRGSAASTITATNAGNTTTVGFQTPTANVNYQFPAATAGTYDICSTAGNCAGSGGGVTTPGGTNNAIAKFTGSQTLGNSNISDTGALVTITGNASVTGSLLLGTALGIGNGGTGTTALTNNGVVIGQGSSPLTTVSAGGAGLCFLSTVGAPTFAACPTGGVTSLNGLTGALSIANASGVGSTVTINDATTGAKGIASFNGTNFTVASGAVNTIQDIATSAAPTFGQLTLTSSQATNPMLLINNTNGGASGNLLDLQVSGSSKFSVQPNGNTAVAGTINGQTISASTSLTGTLAVAGNTTLTGDIAVNGGDITSTGALNITPGGALTVGATTQTLALQGGSSSSFAVTNGGNTTTVNFQAPTANVTYRFATAAAGTYDICSTAGNCAGTGGGVTTAGGTTNRLPKFTAAQVIGDSTISDNGTTVTTTANLTVQGGTLTAGVANTQTGSLTLAYGSANFSGTLTPGALTANRTYTLPDASGTFCLNGASSCGFATGSGAAFVQGGNSFATAADLGTNDANALNLRTSGITRVSIGATGDTTFTGDIAANGGDITSSGALNITPGGALTVGDTGQTLALQGGAGTTLKAVNGGSATTVNFQAPTANVTYRFATTAAGTYDICSTAGNCAGSGGGVTTPGGTTNRLAKFTGSQTINDSTISDNGTTVTTTANMVIQGGTGTIGVAGTTNGSLVLAYGGAAFSGTINTATLTANRTYTLPDVGGTFCLTSGNCLGGGGGGANTALSNLSSVAINTSLLPGTAGTVNLGSAIFPFGDLYIAGTSGTPGTNNFRVTGAATAARTITLPDASGTVCLNGAAACGFATGSGAAFLQNGNSFSATANLGTNDANALALRTNGASRITIAANGSDATFASNMDLIMQGATAYITNAQGSTQGEAFGSGASTGDNAVAVGFGSSAFNGGVAIGQNASTTSTAGVAVGTGSSASFLATALGNSANAAQESTALGQNAVIGAHNSVAIGKDATVNQQFSIAIGQSATTTASNQMVIGANGYEIDHVYVGSGVADATPTGFTLQGTGGSGANVAGADVSIAGGAGTGTANGGNVNIQIAAPGTAGSSANVPTTVLSLSGANGSALFKNVANSATAFEVQTAGGAPVFTVNTTTPGASVAGATTSTGNINSSGGAIQTGGTSRIDNSGNLVNIGNITGSGATNISAGGTLTVGNTGQILALQGNASSTFAVTGGGFTTTVGFTGTPTGAVTYNFDRAAAAGTYVVCTTAGNCLGGGTGGANTSLSNLTGVAINTALLPGAAGTINLGSATLPFGDFYLAGTSGTPGTNNFKLTGAATAARTITIPDASGTVCLQSAAACGFAPTSGSANYIQNQTGSNQTADFQISGSGRAATLNATTGINTGAIGGTQRIDASGNLVNIGNLTATGAITVASAGAGNDVIIDGADQFIVQDVSVLNNNVTISGQAADALTVKSSGNGSGVVVLNVQQSDGDSAARITDTGTIAAGNGTNIAGILALAKGTGSLFGEIHADNITASRTLQFPDVSGTICTDAGNCGSATGTLQTAYNFSAGGTTPEIKLDATRNGIDVQDANGAGIGSSQNFISFRGPNGAGLGSILFGVGTQGNLFVQPSTDRTDLFDINNNAGNNVFTIDSATSNGRVGIGLGGSTLPAYTLDVAGDANLTTGSAYRINGTSICTSSGCTPAAGSGNYIQNQNAGAQATANFWISGTGRSDTSVVTPLLDTASAVTLNIGTSASGISLNQNATVAAGKTLTVTSALTSLTSATTGDALAVSNSTSTGNIAVFKDNATAVVTVGDGGAVLLQNETNQLNALKILTTAASGAHVLFNADTINERVGIGGVATASKFEVQGGDAAIYNSGNNPRLILGDSTSAGQNGYLQWDSANDYFRIESVGTNGVKINDNFVTIGNIFPDQPLKVANGTNLLFQVNTAGAATLVGGQTADLSATAVATANGTGSSLSIAGGNETSNTCGTSCTGGALNLQAGNATGSSGTRNGGSVAIDAGTGNTGNGAVNIGTVNSANVTIGKTTGGSSATLHAGTGGVIIGDGGVANTIQIGNTTGAVSQTVNVGNNATASSVSLVTVGSNIGASSLTLQSGTVGTSLLSTGNVTIGAVDANGTLLVLDTKNTSGDPTGVNGAMYYNSNAGKFRCYQGGAWADCIAASGGFVSLQNAYTNSTGGTTSEIIVDNTRNALDVQDRSTSNGGSIAANLFNVRGTAANDSTAGALLFGVSSTGSVTIAQNLTLQSSTSYISNTQGGPNSESFGDGATTGGNFRATVVGNGATATNNDAVAVGYGTSAANDGVAVGSTAQCINTGCVAIGFGATAAYTSLAAGGSASANANNAVALNGTANNHNSIAINGITTTTNQMVIGATSGGQISSVVIGSGVTDTAPVGFTLQGTSGSGANVAGASTTIAGGQGTGTGVGGSVIFQASAAGGTGPSLNSLSTLGTFAATGLTLGNSALNTPLTLDSGTGTIAIGTGAQARTLNVGTGAAVVQTINIGGTGANVIGMGNTQAAGSVNLGAAMTTGTINVGGASQTGTLTFGQSTASNTINIGAATTATGNTQTVNIGSAATGTGKSVITIGNTNAASALSLLAGTGNLLLQTNSASASVIIKSATNGNGALKVTDSSNVAYLTVNTSATDPGTYITGTGTGGGGSRLYFGPVGDPNIYIGESGTTDTDVMELFARAAFSFIAGSGPDEVLSISQNGMVDVHPLNTFGGFVVNALGAGNNNEVFSVNPDSTAVNIGNYFADNVGTQLVLDTKQNAGDPTGINGGMYYSTDTNTFRCFENSTWKNCITGAGAGLARNAMDTSSAAVTAAGYLYGFTNSSSALASGVLSLDNGTNTNSALKVTASGNPTSGQALIFASNTNATPTGNLLDLQSGTSPVSVFSVGSDATVNVGAVGSSSIASTIHIADTSGAGLQAVTIGSAGNASNSLALLAGNTGQIQIGAVGTSTAASTVHIADTSDATNSQNVFIGSTAGSATKVTIKGGGASGFLKLNVGATGVLGIADGSADATLNLGTGMTTGTINLGGSAQTGTTILGSTSGTNTFQIANGSGATTLALANVQTAGSVSIGAGMTTGTIALGGAVAQTGAITIGQSTGTNTVGIGIGTGATTVQIATGVTNAKTIQIGTGAAMANTISVGGTGANVITVGNTQTAGSIALGSAMTTGTITLGGAVAQTGTIIVGQSTGTNTVRIGDGTGATTVQIGTGVTNAKTLQIGTGAAMANTINIGGTGANVIALGNTQTAGSISLGAAMTTGTITLGGAVAQTGGIIIGQSTGTNTVRLGDGTGATTVQIATGVTNAKTVQIGTGAAMANTISIGGTGANVITMGDTQTGGSVSIGAAMTTGTINIGGTGAQTGTINIGAGTGAQTLNFGTGGTAAKTVTLGSGASTGLTTIQSGTLGISLLSTGNIVVGTSDTTGTLLVLDTKTGSGDPTGVNGGMYYNSNIGAFRCFQNSVWRDCMASARTSFYYMNDYVASSGDSVSLSGAHNGGSFSSSTGTTGHPGIVQLSTGTTTNGDAEVGSNDTGSAYLLGGGDFWRWETDLRLPTLSDATNTYTVRAGFNEGNGIVEPTDGCYFKYSNGVNTGKWQGNCFSNSAGTQCDTTITVAAATFYRLTIVINSAGTNVDFQVNGTTMCSIAATIPTGAGRETSWNVGIVKSASTTARTIELDYIEVNGQFGTAR
ncbi:MAG TPA: hypothetical protein VLH86_03860 [Patescibacteria group bacterium]|nr:hypothetical protein [Patescibacteria group bacterium]